MSNRLAREASPYLRQHGDNPVDWYPWGPEALERAAREDRPILLSIGYSACHWCHVMERESFESEATARLMNERFVNIKVDREERPDLDQTYQLVLALMGRGGGWPLTVFLTPERRPFFAGTYFPPSDRYGMPGFPKVIEAVSDAYRQRRGEVDAQAAELTRAIEAAASGEGRADGPVTPGLLERAMEKVVERFDDEHGGFGRRPKFPNTMALDLLLRAGDHARVSHALGAMRAGGIWDHLGGGFHRYSTDERWLVPHFEKMLYDNALLLRLNVDAWRAMGTPLFAETARSIAAYVAREMTSPEGGFYAAQDADSEGAEGKFFVWTPAEIDAACGEDVDAARVARLAFGVAEKGNFEGSDASVLSRSTPLADVCRALGLDLRDGDAALERARAALFRSREQRERPLRDEKILASWNGLMAGALAAAGAALGERSWIDAAARALDFIERTLVVGESGGCARVRRHVKDGVAHGVGFLDDHAFVADAALDLYEATGDARWVRLARSLARAIVTHFSDDADGGFFFTPDDADAVLVRIKDSHDNAVPSGASVACRALLRLGALVEPNLGGVAERAVQRLATAASENPLAMSITVALTRRLLRGSVDIVLVGPLTSPATAALASAVHRSYVPDLVLAWADPADPRALDACALLAAGKAVQPEPVAYVCRERTCSLPIVDPSTLAGALS
jgi:hypothetical protein